MRKTLTLFLLGLLLAACSREPGTDSQLYDRYRQRTDFTAAWVEGFRLNDTVKVDVLILVADDAEAWTRLKQELDIRTTEGVTSWLGEAGNPAKRTPWTGAPCLKVLVSHAQMTVCLYHLTGKADYDALLEYQMDKITEKRD